MTGGLAMNVSVVQRVEKALGVRTIEIRPDPQTAGDVGMALPARDFLFRLTKQVDVKGGRPHETNTTG